MDIPFSVEGRKIKVHRYRVDYEDEQLGPMCEFLGEESRAQSLAETLEGRVTALNSSAYEWMDGLEVPEGPDPFGEAVKIYHMGQTACEEQQNTPSSEEDGAAMLVDHEYRLTLLELGVTE